MSKLSKRLFFAILDLQEGTEYHVPREGTKCATARHKKTFKNLCATGKHKMCHSTAQKDF
jgi:hypothetical protein